MAKTEAIESGLNTTSCLDGFLTKWCPARIFGTRYREPIMNRGFQNRNYLAIKMNAWLEGDRRWRRFKL